MILLSSANKNLSNIFTFVLSLMLCGSIVASDRSLPYDLTDLTDDKGEKTGIIRLGFEGDATFSSDGSKLLVTAKDYWGVYDFMQKRFPIYCKIKALGGITTEFYLKNNLVCLITKNRNLTVIESSSGKNLWSKFFGNEKLVNVFFNKNESYLIAHLISQDTMQRVVIFEARNGKELHTLSARDNGPFWYEFVSDRLIVEHNVQYGETRLWNIDQMMPQSPLKIFNSIISSATDGSRILVRNLDGSFSILNTISCKETSLKEGTISDADYKNVVFSADNSMLMVYHHEVRFPKKGDVFFNIYGNSWIKVFDAESGAILFDVRGNGSPKFRTKTKNRMEIATITDIPCYGCGVEVLTNEGNRILVKSLCTCSDEICTVAYDTLGQKILTYHFSGGFNFWNADTLELLSTFSSPGGCKYEALQFGSDGSKIIASWMDKDGNSFVDVYVDTRNRSSDFFC